VLNKIVICIQEKQRMPARCAQLADATTDRITASDVADERDKTRTGRYRTLFIYTSDELPPKKEAPAEGTVVFGGRESMAKLLGPLVADLRLYHFADSAVRAQTKSS
jgi:hypothetical protein